MWAWMPDELDAPGVEPGSRSTASAAAPDASPKPNFESSWPVRTNSWVWASTPGVTLPAPSGRGWRLPGATARAAAARVGRSRRRSRSPFGRRRPPGPRPARRSDLLLPCSTSRSAGHAGGQGHVHLATGGHVEAHAFLVGQPGHGPAQEGLGGVGHAVTPGGDRLAAAVRADGPRRRRTAACRTARPARPGRPRRSRRRPSVPICAVVGQEVALDRPRRVPAPAPSIGDRSHRLRGRHAEQAEADGEPDPGRLDQPQAGLGQCRVDVAAGSGSRGRSRGSRWPAGAPRW